MSASHRPVTHLRRAWAALVVAALAAVLLPVSSHAEPPPPTATAIQFTSIATPSITLPGTPGASGNIYVVAGTPFDVSLEFEDSTGAPAPLSWNQTTEVAVSDGHTELASTDVAPEATTATLSGLVIPTPATHIELTASAATRPRATTGTSPTFDVLITSKPINTTGRSTIGGVEGAGACDATTDKPICADLYAPLSQFVEGGLLSQGLCDSSCRDSYVQALAQFTWGDNPDRADPATLVMHCDKLTCGTKAIKSQHLTVQLTPSSSPVTAPACPAKAVVGSDQTFCVDYVQSTRDNAGDTLLYLLFVDDALIRWP